MNESNEPLQDANLTQENQIPSANPGRRLIAYLIDMVIATLPLIIVSTMLIGTANVSILYLAFYPAPVIGTLLSTSVATFTVVKTEETLTTVSSDGVVTTQTLNRDDSINPMISIFFGLSILFYLFYSLITSLIFKGQTIGKKLLHLRVYQTSRSPAKSSTIAIREVLGKVLINSVPLAPIVSLFVMLLTKDHKTLHDSLAGTMICQE